MWFVLINPGIKLLFLKQLVLLGVSPRVPLNALPFCGPVHKTHHVRAIFPGQPKKFPCI
jgi:hypothetical protein